MWDKQNRQSRDFQVQNIMMGRYGLFREDIRDLANLTTSKMDSYLIVNTLKLGFIVTMFFNYDRADNPKELTQHEFVVVLFFTTCFLTSFFCLLTSIWFSMHATVVAQSFMTKMLVHTVRIPFPSVQEVERAVPLAQEFETEIDTAFRVPLFAKTRGSKKSGPSGPANHLAVPQSGSQPNHTVSQSYDLPQRSSSSSADNRPTRAVSSPLTTNSQMSQGKVDTAERRSPPQVFDIGLDEENFEPEGDGTFPHLKLYSLLMSHWQPFDLYSKVTMCIGTSIMLSGMAYYGLFYARMRQETAADIVQVLKSNLDGWLIFLILSVLSWWCVTFDLFLEKRIHYVFVAALGLCGPLVTCINMLSGGPALRGMILTFICQTLWVSFLSFSAITWNGELPVMWRASLYLDVLSKTGFGPDFEGNKDLADAMGRRLAAASQGRENAGRAHEVVEQERREAVARGGRALCRPAVLLLKCLDIVLASNDREPDLPEDVRIKVQAARDRLREAAKAAGVLRDVAPGGPAEGFMLMVPTEDGQEYPRLINPQPAEFGVTGFGGDVPGTFQHGVFDVGSTDSAVPRRFASAPLGIGSSTSSTPSFRPTLRATAPEAVHQRSGARQSTAGTGSAKAGRLDELMQKTREITKALVSFSSSWTPKDAQALEAYGGRTYMSPNSFAAQFRSKGHSSKRGIGTKAIRFYQAGVVFIVMAWLFGIIACYSTILMETAGDPSQTLSLSRAVAAHVLSQKSAPLPESWFSPTSIACDTTGDRLAFSDGIRAFTLNQTTGAWAGPFSACGRDVAAISFDDSGGLLAALDAAIVPSESVEEVHDGVRHAACDLPHSTEAALEAFALKSSPAGLWPPDIAGLAIRKDNILLALEAATPKAKRKGMPRVTGILGVAPDGQRLLDVSLLGDMGWVLDSNGAVLELDVSTGHWTGGLWRLQPEYQWLGICALTGGGGRAEGLLALGRPAVRPPAPGTAAELWHFSLGTFDSEESTSTSLEQVRF